jgi:hypothetical protein
VFKRLNKENFSLCDEQISRFKTGCMVLSFNKDRTVSNGFDNITRLKKRHFKASKFKKIMKKLRGLKKSFQIR